MTPRILAITGSSPKFKRRLDEVLGDGKHLSSRKVQLIRDQRVLYDYPKHPPKDTLLIPIRLDVDVEGYRYIDSYSWNL